MDSGHAPYRIFRNYEGTIRSAGSGRRVFTHERGEEGVKIMNHESKLKSNSLCTLEAHLEILGNECEEAKKLQSIWILLRGDLEEHLQRSQSTFVTFSLHDSSHSRSIIRNIERFLGTDRIEQLSVTDTFVLLVCAYAHDFGMALSIEDIYELLGSNDLRDFIFSKNDDSDILEPEDAKAIHILADYIRCELCNRENQRQCINDRRSRLESVYFSIIIVIQMYIRPQHWKGVEKIEQQYKKLLSSRLNIRFVRSIISICQAHGQDIHVLEEIEPEADGFANDVYHPRFIAAMLRLGDLLDIDNGRFPKWFFEAEEQGTKLIPKLSELHFKKHESISHLRIVPEYIEITSSCRSNGSVYDEDAYAVAEIASEWFEWIRLDCEYLAKNWSMIAGGQFGAPPGELHLKVFVDDKPYVSFHQRLQFQMPQDRVMKLLEGTNIYQDRFVSVREILQNAVDASLLQLWYDIIHNAYVNIGLGKEVWEKYLPTGKEKCHLPIWVIPSSIYENYNIKVEVVWDKDHNKVRLVIKDRGIGITQKDVKYMARIGSSKEENPRIKTILKTMPDWLKPSGTFGIGLQSAFQLTNQLQFYTRRPNEPERHIIFHSYAKNQGKIEIRELRDDPKGPFYDNSPQGTNVLIEVDIDKVISNKEFDKPDNFLNLDLKFTPKNPTEAVYIIMSNVVKKELQTIKSDYFNVSFENIVVEHGIAVQKGRAITCRSSFFKESKLSTLSLFELIHRKNAYNFSNTVALFWDEDTSKFYRLKVQRCTIKDNRVQFPRPRMNPYRIMYKFNEISHVESLYGKNFSSDRLSDVDRNGFITWDILIMDDCPNKYLNIDRDHLKEGAFCEDQLLDIKAHIMEKWCQFFVDEAKGESKQDNNNPSRNRFKDQANILVSLMLLFYQYTSVELFKQFASFYGQEVENLCLKGYQYPLKKLWDEEAQFKTTYRIFSKKSFNRIDAYPLDPSTVELLPLRLFHITEINGTYVKDSHRVSKIQYISRLKGMTDDYDGINMNEAASIFDYVMAFDPNIQYPTRTRLDSIIKKVFKPNRKFQNIITRTRPTSFRLGRNFCWRMDFNICSYILSPFDDASVKILRKYLQTRPVEDPGENRKEQLISEMSAYFSERTNGILSNQQLYYCARYVLYEQKKHQHPDAFWNENNAMDRIIDDYMKFIQDFCSVVFDNRDFIINQFLSNQPSID